MRARLAAVVIAFLSLLLGSVSAVASSEHFNPPKGFYLALGDSLAFGFQFGKFLQEKATGTYDPATFNTGYVDDFATDLATVSPGVQTVNLSCPGESTVTFTGSCFYHVVAGNALHVSYPGSQEDFALAFLQAHRGQVSPVTITLGANDFNPLLLSCGGPTNIACVAAGVPAVLSQVKTNMDQILGSIRAAAPDTEIIVMQYYNPYGVLSTATDASVLALNGVLAQAATAHGARLADAFTPFNLAGPEPATLCALTLFCTPLQDTHASDAGYAVIAQQFWLASGYSRLGD